MFVFLFGHQKFHLTSKESVEQGTYKGNSTPLELDKLN